MENRFTNFMACLGNGKNIYQAESENDLIDELNNNLNKELAQLYKQLAQETSSLGLEIVQEIINLEIELEKNCNN